jgi:lipopolysaccharide transport system ATP-binding protein
VSDLAVSVEGLGKRYRIAHQRDRYGRLTESLSSAVRAPFDRLRGRPRETAEWFWALRDVSFELRQGDVLGVIGRNGAGKTTLLKVLSRITEPTAGIARLRGRVGSLLEVGTGFHPELTGRENVFMSGAVLGMRKAEIAGQFDEIVEFAGIENFLDTPVKRYSSGMQVRLGFAVAAHMQTEILIVDEVLAVGDAEFQRKCLDKMGTASTEGRTVLFVSHNMAAVETLCRTGLLLDKGKLLASGTAHQTVEAYRRQTDELRDVDLLQRSDRQGDGRIRVASVEPSISTGKPSDLRLNFVAQPGVRNVEISVGLFTNRGEGALFLSNRVSGDELGELPAHGALVCTFETAGLLPGRYSTNVYCTASGILADWLIDAVEIEVGEGDYYGTGRLPPPGYGSVAVPYRWSVER